MARIIFLTGWKTFNINYTNSKSTFAPRERRTPIKKTLSDHQNYDTSDEIYPSVPTTNDTNNNAVYSVISTNNKAYMDIIGSFQYFSRQGNEYVLIVYH